MAESVVTVDLLNPGQVFACLGLLEATEILTGEAAAVFDWTRLKARFRLSGPGDEAPVVRVFRFLEESRAVARVPAGTVDLKGWNYSRWGSVRTDAPGSPYPFPYPDSPAELPAVLRDHEGNEIPVEYWGDATKRDSVKFWGGSAGYPGAARLQDAVRLAKGKARQYASNPFELSAVQTSSFRFDWRRDYVPVDVGFSPNRHSKSPHSKVSMVGFPVVELLAAIGVTHARPRRVDRLRYQYGVIGGGTPLDPVFLRAALGAPSSPVPGAPFRRFTMNLGSPGQEGKERCITHVTEDTPNDHDS